MNEKTFNKIVGKPGLRGKDSDRDGVIDMIDCQPYNAKKQGILHEIKHAAVSKAREVAGGYRQKVAAERQIRKKAKAEYYRAREKEAMAEARGKARIEREESLKRYRTTQKSRGSGWDIAGGLQRLAGEPSGAIRTPSKRTGMKKVTKYVKTGKGQYKKKTYYKPIYAKKSPTKQPSVMDIDLGL